MSHKDRFNLEEKALGAICINLSDEIYYSILYIKSPSALWAKLKSKYMIKSLTSRTYLKKQLYYLRMGNSDSLHSHLHKFNKLCNDLLCIDEKIIKDDKTFILINSLNSVYQLVAKSL